METQERIHRKKVSLLLANVIVTTSTV